MLVSSDVMANPWLIKLIKFDWLSLAVKFQKLVETLPVRHWVRLGDG